MRRGLLCAGLVVGAVVLAAPGQNVVQLGTPAPDFPPGVSTDGTSIHLSDFVGKVVVLWFFEKQCPRCIASVPEGNALVKACKDRPVKFIAISPGSTIAEAVAFRQQTGLVMPIFADSLRLMEKRYGFQISLRNISQFRILSTDGKIVGVQMDPGLIDRTLADTRAHWKYKSLGYDARLFPALEAFEWGQYTQGMKLLGPARKSFDRTAAESANKLFDEVKKEGEAWKAEGDKWADSDAVQAYDSYSKVASVFAGDELGKSVAEPLKTLTANKTVTSELAARKAFVAIESGLSQTTPMQKPMAIKALQDFARKYPKTPTGDRAAALATELGN
jgi:peroxiredoxin